MHLALAALFVFGTLPPLAALAADPAASQSAQAFQSLRDKERQIHERHEQALQSLQTRINAGGVEADYAVMERDRLNRQYQRELGETRAGMQSAYQAMEDAEAKASRSKGGGSSRGLSGNSALPRFQSQSVISYPPSPETPPADEKPQAEGRQKNTGFGTRELEF